ncbi:uracil-DNA glycosylase family protein [Botrimarina sp.]|uniref:uracil-DNA glycosylase family protein n=1 Tax=Botrimarina sp. TaxID=2795802 RepID=UPI0032EF31C1
MSQVDALIENAQTLRRRVARLRFAPPVTHVYNPLVYAWAPHEAYLRKAGAGRKRVVFLGMNPGPWGMAQTGVPFGEVAAARDWIGVDAPVSKPKNEHPKRPVEGFACRRSEVSGRRLWGLFAGRFGSADAFFREHFVANYCPLVFMTESGKNHTPDKLPAAEREPLAAACEAHLAELLERLRPEWAVGVGKYAENCLDRVAGERVRVTTVLHPSPASPAANRGWAEAATGQLEAAGVW